MPEDNGSVSGGGGGGSKNVIAQKVGPFPLWGWAAIAGAAIGVLMIVRRQQSASYTPGQTPTVSAGGLGVTSADPLTAQQLLEQMSALTQAMQATVAPQQTVASGPGAGQIQLLSLSSDPRGFAVWNFDKNNQGILGFLPVGAIVTILGEATDFNGDQGWLVQYGNKIGFINGKFVGGMGAPPPFHPPMNSPLSGHMLPTTRTLLPIVSGTAGAGLNAARAGVPPPFAAPGSGTHSA